MSLPKRSHDVHAALANAFNTGDIHAVLNLYEDDAVLIPQPGQSVSGKSKLKEALEGFLTIKGKMEIKTIYCFETGEVALSRSLWSIIDNGEVKIQAKGTELLKKQTDGSWLLAIDHPFGADELAN